eukprot:TRINITY_DN32818_c0_g1_i1.p1 TRINITY_DN32818_c0_g1~~TRINITY_DN32818_c0_g1_i1.p1  ORF type:complete len:495 (+),score=134.07 TRINITY_DN32818_c0_g1_i1:76-1485(+)
MALSTGVQAAPRVAILGAGLAGGSAAAAILRGGIPPGSVRPHVVTFDRRPHCGGRMHTRSLQEVPNIDVGAHSFRAPGGSGNAAWDAFLRRLFNDGVVEEWHCSAGRLTRNGRLQPLPSPPHYRGIGGAQRIVEHLFEGAEMRLGTGIRTGYWRGRGGWLLIDDDGEEHTFDWVVATSPGLAREDGPLRNAAECAGAYGYESQKGVQRLVKCAAALGAVPVGPQVSLALVWREDDEGARAAVASLPFDVVEVEGCRVLSRIERQGPAHIVARTTADHAAAVMGTPFSASVVATDPLSASSSEPCGLAVLMGQGERSEQARQQAARHIAQATAAACLRCGVRLPQRYEAAGGTAEDGALVRGGRRVQTSLALWQDAVLEAAYRANTWVPETRLGICGDFVAPETIGVTNQESSLHCSTLVSRNVPACAEFAATSGLRTGHEVLQALCVAHTPAGHHTTQPMSFRRAYCYS